MAPLSDKSSGSSTGRVAEPDRLTGRSPANVADEIGHALERAAGPSVSEKDGAKLDTGVVRGLASATNVDDILEILDLNSLAALADRCAGRLADAAPETAVDRRETAWALLDVLRRSAVLRRIAAKDRASWSDRILALIDRSNFTVGPLFRQRVSRYGSKILFEVPSPRKHGAWSWRRVAARVDLLSRVLLSLDDAEEPAPIALLSENRIEIALLDLACLTSGIINVMIPANATESDVGFILRHSRAGTVIVSDESQLRKVLRNRKSLPELKMIVSLDRVTSREAGIFRFDDLTHRAESVARSTARERSESIRCDDLATIMYTSGTTGTPKGIQFSHRNIVFKRFARALALPEIGEDDVLLCFLPLYHTFGRFLELLGCVFWGAKYCFLESTALESLARGMRRHRPTMFISVPKKWTQLHELIAQHANPETASDTEIGTAVRRVTGGRLRWGLSAAGYLDSDIFRFFQRQGVELMSGFGMTEATGGITMTYPGDYQDGSLGTALPGIEMQLADDGELLVRGPYVMTGYLDPPDNESSFDKKGWFHTGDLMRADESGHLQLVDRKKEIYKNVKGETIAPQRVENLFRDFDSVGRAFLIGDHRDYNTLLIYPNPDYKDIDFATQSIQEIQDHFRSLVVSVNKFLAPYERVVDFAIIDRDLDAEHGELTSKGTIRRKTAEQNFSEIVRPLYRRASVHVGNMDLVIPNWLFQILGLTAQDIRFEEEAILLPSTGARLTVSARPDRHTRIGSCLYRYTGNSLNLGSILTSPRLWLGNEDLVSFVRLDTVTRQRTWRKVEGVEWAGRIQAYSPAEGDHAQLESLVGRDEPDLLDLDLAARMLGSENEVDALLAVRVLEEILQQTEGPLAEPARLLLGRMVSGAPRNVRRRAFQVLAPVEKTRRFGRVLRGFLLHDAELLDAETCIALAEGTLAEGKIEAFIDLTDRACSDDAGSNDDTELAAGLLEFLATYGADHPVSFRRIRSFLQRINLFAASDETRERAGRAGLRLQEGFRAWLGPSSRIAVDPERGREFGWEDVVVFDEGIPDGDQRRLMSAFKHASLVKEAVFLFSVGAVIRLGDIQRNGVRVRLLGSRHGKSVYRITVQTRYQGSFDLAVNLNHDMTAEQVQEEIQWLILSGDPGNSRGALVEDFGGYWPAQDLWSEEFIAGETLDQAMLRLSRLRDHGPRMRRIWPFMAWATLSSCVDFWYRSGKRLEIADPSMANIVVPTQDFLAGVRIVSVSRRRPHTGLLAMLRAFREGFVTPAEEQYPVIRGIAGWGLIFSALLEVVGEEEGLDLLRSAIDEAGAEDDAIRAALRKYIHDVSENGFVPLRLFFAIERYRRWSKLSKATPQARARTLRELYETYSLQRLAATYPEIRVRFFTETAFEGCSPALADGLREMIQAIRDDKLASEDLIDAVDELRTKRELRKDDDYFLARLSYPYLRPEDAAGFVRTDFGGRRQSEIVVTLEDRDRNPFRVRHALNPKEVERLFRLFLAAKLDVRFRMEHQHLVAINERSQIIGGIYYEIEKGDESAHLEKIVVAERYRGKRVADGLMTELVNRLRIAGVKTLTTGYFRPDYFHHHGFRLDKHFSGLVKSLEEDSAD